MENAMMLFGDERRLLSIWDLTFYVFVLRSGEVFGSHSDFFCFV